MGISVVADQLKAADDLAHGEETQHLGSEDTTSSQLCVGETAHGLHGVRRRDAGADGLHQGPGALKRLPRVLEVGLERGCRPVDSFFAPRTWGDVGSAC